MSGYLGQCNSYSSIIVSISNVFQVLVDCGIVVGHIATQRLVLQKSTKPTWFLQKFCRNCTCYDPVEPYILLQKTAGWPDSLKIPILKNTPAKYISRAINGTTTSILAEIAIFGDFGVLQNSAESCRILQILQNSAEFCRIGAQKALAGAPMVA